MMNSLLLEDWTYLVAEMVLLLDVLFLLVFTEKFTEKRSERTKEK